METRDIINIVDNLTSTSSTDALSANQGRVLKEMIDNIDFSSDISSYTYNNQKSGVIQFTNGLLIQHGRVEVTPTAANVPAYQTVTYSTSYTYAPVVITQVATNYPALVHSAPRDGSPTGFKAYVQRDNTNTTGIEWIAIGYKNVSEDVSE